MIVAYLSILTVSEPVFVTVAVNFSSSIELMLPEGPDSSMMRPSALLEGAVSTTLARQRVKSAEKSIVKQMGVFKVSRNRSSNLWVRLDFILAQLST